MGIYETSIHITRRLHHPPPPPPPAPHVLASSLSGAIAHWRRKNVDIKMGLFLLAGGILGSTAGVNLFKILRGFGQIDVIIQFLFLIFLGFVGFSMLFETFF